MDQFVNKIVLVVTQDGRVIVVRTKISPANQPPPLSAPTRRSNWRDALCVAVCCAFVVEIFAWASLRFAHVTTTEGIPHEL